KLQFVHGDKTLFAAVSNVALSMNTSYFALESVAIPSDINESSPSPIISFVHLHLNTMLPVTVSLVILDSYNGQNFILRILLCRIFNLYLYSMDIIQNAEREIMRLKMLIDNIREFAARHHIDSEGLFSALPDEIILKIMVSAD